MYEYHCNTCNAKKSGQLKERKEVICETCKSVIYQESTVKNNYFCLRLWLATIYLFVGIVILLVFNSGKYDMFYLDDVTTKGYNFIRFLWCISIALMSFSVRLFLGLIIDNHFDKKSPILEITVGYTIILVIISLLAFSIFNAIDGTNGFIFYYISMSFCMIFSILIDSFWNIVLSITDTIIKLLK